jgi:hypothetical protein
MPLRIREFERAEVQVHRIVADSVQYLGPNEGASAGLDAGGGRAERDDAPGEGELARAEAGHDDQVG